MRIKKFNEDLEENELMGIIEDIFVDIIDMGFTISISKRQKEWRDISENSYYVQLERKGTIDKKISIFSIFESLYEINDKMETFGLIFKNERVLFNIDTYFSIGTGTLIFVYEEVKK